MYKLLVTNLDEYFLSNTKTGESITIDITDYSILFYFVDKLNNIEYDLLCEYVFIKNN
jgi:hypothetical protein